MSGPKLILHVGQPKTGTSALQSAFALSMGALARNGIVYPKPDRFNEAIAGRITSGNCNPFDVQNIYSVQSRSAAPDGGILLSNEGSFRVFREDPHLLQTMRDKGVKVVVILFVRDPMEEVFSSYIQSIKRGGATGIFRIGPLVFQPMDWLQDFLIAMNEVGVDLRIRNYSRVRETLLPQAEVMLRIPKGTLIAPPVANVNRSLNRAESELVRQLNKAIGMELGASVADALCNDLPDIPSEKPLMPRKDYWHFRTKAAPRMEAINKLLPSHAALRIPTYDKTYGDVASDVPPALRLSEAQVEVVQRVLDAQGASIWGAVFERGATGEARKEAHAILDRFRGAGLPQG